MKSHRSYVPDQTRIILWLLYPLLALNGLLWTLYAHAPFMAALWFAMAITSLFYLRR